LHITGDCFHVDVITGIQQGDQWVFQQAFLQWQPKVFTYLLRRTKDEDFATELTQLTFIKLWDFRHTLDTGLSFDTQVFRIARTTMIDALRARTHRRKFNLDMDAQHDLSLVQEYDTGSFDLSHALNTLPPARKKVFLLNRIYGYSYKQIAGELSISDRTVEKHISLALKQLRKMLSLFSLLSFFLKA